MTEQELKASLDAHDVLVKACVDGDLSFTDSLSAYGNFPRGYVVEDQALLRWYGRRIAFALSCGGASYDNLISIEHVLPQTVESNSTCAALFPDVNAREDWTRRLGNLVFLTRRINSKASNWDFDRNKREYFVSKDDGTSPFPLTQGVLRATEWTPEHLKERQSDLLNKLCKVRSLTAAPAITK